MIGLGMLAVSAIGAGVAASGANKAAKTQAAAGNASIAEQQREFEVAQSANAPWQIAGQQSLAQLKNLLGVGSPTPSTEVPQQLVDTSSGAPSPVQELYQSNPFYKQAWDSFLSEHQKTFNSGFTSGSNVAAIDQQVRDRMKANIAAAPAQQASPDFGSLVKPFSMADFQADPGYAFRLGAGTEAIEGSAAARGMQLSSATLNELQRFGQDYASNEFQNAYQRYNQNQSNQFSRLSQLSGVGQNAAQNTGQSAMATGQNVGNTMQGIGNAAAAGQVGVANAISSGLTNTASSYNQQQLLSSIFGQAKPAVSSTPSYGSSAYNSLGEIK